MPLIVPLRQEPEQSIIKSRNVDRNILRRFIVQS
jgi:hypothetical protein